MMTVEAEVCIFNEILAAAEDDSLTQYQYNEVFERALSQNFRKDAATLSNLGILAAKSGRAIEAILLAKDNRDINQLYSAFCICRVFIEKNGDTKDGDFAKVIRSLAEAGHIQSIIYVRTSKFKNRIIRKILGFLTRMSLLPWAMKLAFRNPSDPRLDRKVIVRQSSD